MKALPLFNWRELLELERLRQDREALLSRIRTLRPHAHKRVALEERARLVTLQAIELEAKLFGGTFHD